MASVYSVWNSTIESFSQIPNYIRYPNPPKVERPDNSMQDYMIISYQKPHIKINSLTNRKVTVSSSPS